MLFRRRRTILKELGELRGLLAEGVEAMRLTREYVGVEALPPVAGWSWFDWATKAATAAGHGPQSWPACIGSRNASASPLAMPDLEPASHMSILGHPV